MTDDSGASDGAGSETNRRTVLKSLGAAGVALPSEESLAGFTSAGPDETAALASLADGDDFSVFDAVQGGILKHTDTYVQQPETYHEEELPAITSQHGIAYLGVEWQDYGNPAGRGGCWRHTFFVTSIASSTTIATVYENDPDREPGDVEPLEQFSESILEVDVDEGGDGTTDDGDDYAPDQWDLAVSVRRDSDLLGILGTDDLTDYMDSDVELKKDDGTTEDTDVKTVVTRCGGDEDVGERSWECETLPEFDARDIEEEWGKVDRVVEHSAMYSLMLTGLTILASVTCQVCIAFGFVGNVLINFLGMGFYSSEVEFDEGARFVREFGTDHTSTGHESYVGHSMMFDVFVDPKYPGEDPDKGTFTVKSQHVPDGHDFDDTVYDQEGTFNSQPVWQFSVEGLPKPDDTEVPPEDRFTIEPMEYYESFTNVDASEFLGQNLGSSDAAGAMGASALQDESVISLPDPRFRYDPELAVPDEQVTFLGANSTPSHERDDVTYAWTVWEEGDPEAVVAEGNGPELDHTFTGEGRYVAELRIVDDRSGDSVSRRTRRRVGVEERAIETAVARRGGVATAAEIETAETTFWSEDEPVPGTGGTTAATEQIQEMVQRSNEALGRYDTSTPWGVKDE